VSTSEDEAESGFIPRKIPCSVYLDQPGQTAIVVRGGRAVLRTLPGEAVRYTSGQLSELIDALQAARYELRRAET